jgi:hypothetical protein
LIMERDGEMQKNASAAKWFNGWIKQNKSHLEDCCAGVAMVTSSSGLLKLYRPLAKKLISKTFGCPGDMFTMESEAIAWLHEQMGKG